MSLAEPAIASPYTHASVKRRKNTWYSLRDGNWNDPNTWISNAIAFSQFNFNYPGQAVPNPIFPAVGDDVYINHNVTANTSVIVNNLRVSGYLTFSASVSISVYGDIQSLGTVDMTGANCNLILYGGNNFITTFICGSSGTVVYARQWYDQYIMDLSYQNLKAINIGTKYIQVNTAIAGNLTTDTATLELSTYNLTVNGTTNINNSSTLSKTGSGSLLFIGKVNSNFGVASFTGNPSIELRGGLNLIGSISSDKFGTGTLSCTTNNQSIDIAGGILQLDNINIVGAITVSLENHTNGPLQINNYINGTAAGSTFLNKGLLQLNTTTLPMITGVFDWLTYSTSSIGYVMISNYTLPYTTYNYLWTSGSGTKYLSGNTTVNQGVKQYAGSLNGFFSVDLNSFNLTVNGDLIISSAGALYSLTSSSILVTGALIFSGSTSNAAFTGNPSVEVRGGISCSANGFITGAPVFTLSTNNQSITGSPGSFDFGSSSFIISGITLTVTVTGIFIVTKGSINGTNGTSVFDNRGTGAFYYQNAQRPMLTGILTTNAAANTFKYNLTGNQDVTGGTYRTLELGGSGVKTLQGNVVVNTTAGGSWSITGSATINYNGYTITTI